MTNNHAKLIRRGRCPIPGCEKVFSSGHMGIDAHIHSSHSDRFHDVSNADSPSTDESAKKSGIKEYALKAAWAMEAEGLLDFS